MLLRCTLLFIFSPSAVCKVLWVALDASRSAETSSFGERDGVGAEQSAQKVKFSIGASFDVIFRKWREEMRHSLGCLRVSHPLSISPIPYLQEQSEREDDGKDRIDYYTCS